MSDPFLAQLIAFFQRLDASMSGVTPPPPPPPPPGPDPDPDWPGNVEYDNALLSSPTSFWNKPLPALDAGRLTHPQSTEWVKNFCAQIQIDYAASSGPYPTAVSNPNPGKAWWSSDGNNVCYVVPEDQPLVYVAVRDQVNESPKYSMKVIPHSYELNLAFMRGVPMPEGVDPRHLGTADSTLVIYQPSTDRLWEFIGMWPQDEVEADWENPDKGEGHYPPVTGQAYTWTCNWGGYMENVSESPGLYQNRFNDAGVQVEWAGWGATAIGVPYITGCITGPELWAVWNDEAEDFGHTLKVMVGDASSLGVVYPAARGDGTVGLDSWIQEGSRLFLPASLDSSAAVYPHKFVRALVKTYQKYGGVIYDKTGFGCVPWAFRSGNTSSLTTPWFPIDLFLPTGAHFPPTEIVPPDITWQIPWHLMKVADPSLSGGAVWSPPPPPIVPPTVVEVHQAALDASLSTWVNDDDTHAFFPGATSSSSAGPPLSVKTVAAANQGVAVHIPGTFDFSKIHRISIWLKGQVGGEVVRLFWGYPIIGDWTVSAPITLTTGWVLHTVDWIVSSPTAERTGVNLAVRCDSGGTYYAANSGS